MINPNESTSTTWASIIKLNIQKQYKQLRTKNYDGND